MRTPSNHALRPDALRRRSMPAIGAALLAVVVAAAPVGAVTVTVRMDSSQSFRPATTTINQGDKIKWKNTSRFTVHDVHATAPSGYFSSPGGSGGMGEDETYTKLFRAAGSYPYICREHSGMTGKIKVRLGARKIDGGERFRLTLASASQSGYQHVLWVDRPGTSGWTVVTTTSNTTYTYDPSSAGTYKFKSELKRTSGGATSDFSPVESLTYNP